MRTSHHPAPGQAGFSLLELLIAVAIIAIIVTVAVPAYQRYVVNTVRTQAKSQLTQVATRQQQFYLDNKSYANTLKDLGYGANPVVVDRDGREVADGSDDAAYKISFSTVSANAYTVQAAPLKSQAQLDSSCGTLSLTHLGRQGQTGTGKDCW